VGESVRDAVIEGYRQGYEDAQHGIPARPQDLEVRDANLYAAAPDLLAALERVVKSVYPLGASMTGIEDYSQGDLEAARAAIAKAKGEA